MTRLACCLALVFSLGCSDPMDFLVGAASLPVQVTLTRAERTAAGTLSLEVSVRNTGGEALVLRVRCSPIEIDRDDAGTWRRIGDLRLCAPPDTMRMPGGATLTLSDDRPFDGGGRFRVAIVDVDGREAYSEPFVLP